jgi:hypothetical protein
MVDPKGCLVVQVDLSEIFSKLFIDFYLDVNDIGGYLPQISIKINIEGVPMAELLISSEFLNLLCGSCSLNLVEECLFGCFVIPVAFPTFLN